MKQVLPSSYELLQSELSTLQFAPGTRGCHRRPGVRISASSCPRLTSHSGQRLAGTDLLSPSHLACLVYTLHVKRHIHRDRTNSSHCITSPSRCLDTLNGRKQNCCDTSQVFVLAAAWPHLLLRLQLHNKEQQQLH